jgi:allantoinase
LPEFPRADPETLERGMREAARLNLPVAVHAESEEITRALAQQMAGSTARDFVMSRPVAAEVAAIDMALACARATGAKLHIVHVSSGSGVAAAIAARAGGVDVSIETCPHYLYFTDEDLEQIDVAGKCAPPLRGREEHQALWLGVLDGRVDIVASDHSPCDPSLKKSGDFRASWGGVAGVQSTLAVLMERGLDGRRLRFEQVTSLVAAAPAARFGLPSKGRIRAGDDADLALVDTCRSYRLRPDDLLQKHKMSPYVGRSFTGTVVRTIRRGETIFLNGRIVAEGRGRFVRPHA